MGRSLTLIGVIVGSLALSSTGLRGTPVMQASRGAVLLRYHYALGETMAYAYRERITSTSATARTTTALRTYRQRLHVVRGSAAGVATAAFSESRRTLTTTTSGHSSVVTQPVQLASTMALYPDGRSYIRSAHSTTGGTAGTAPVFPAYPVAPGAQWSRPGASDTYRGGSYLSQKSSTTTALRRRSAPDKRVSPYHHDPQPERHGRDRPSNRVTAATATVSQGVRERREGRRVAAKEPTG